MPDESDTPPLAHRLRRALDEAETDVQDMGHVWLFDDQVVGEAALRLVARDRALLADYEAAGSKALAWMQFEVLHGEVERAAAFWLGEVPVDR
ncbi:hypothetical protein Drose_04300 [Dactylosporangium roseum]|uniref:Uncharacterized protein n=1 Tax=Dactylosporangium roseum TaxID=47989 RepID=A0ABY5Z660_9ACTN|nr:hypothetical protein [Dactylosporangium roseum]UWZ37511.1 hypothetical protein Drose_04300 [Dactylosporangium roseum]